MSNLRELYRAEQLPVFQNKMFATPQEAISCVKGDMVLVQDLRTGLIFNSDFQPQLMHYDVDYQNEQAVSPAFRSHLHDVAGIIERHFRGMSLIEIGCGKGYFLEHLQQLGFGIVALPGFVWVGCRKSGLRSRDEGRRLRPCATEICTRPFSASGHPGR